MECKKVIEILEKQSPKSYACDWDNVGLLVGREDKEIQKIYIALDATDEAIEEAIANGADMLLTHHPMIFKGMKRVTQEDFIGRRIIRLIQNDMVYYAMHTNFDVIGMAALQKSSPYIIRRISFDRKGTDVAPFFLILWKISMDFLYFLKLLL